MAQPQQITNFVCRSCRQSALRAHSQVRAFGSSASRSKTIPSFQQTSSPELDALLLDWRNRVFKPAALNKTHQALIYKKSRHVLLGDDPGVIVTMTDGEDVKLEPQDRFDKPNQLASLKKITKILETTSSADVWLQLPAFLEGMQLAGRTVPGWWLEKLTRKANEQGRGRVIKQCAAMVKRTGLSLSNASVTRELFLGCHEEAVNLNFRGEDFKQVYQNAMSLALMLEQEDHCGGVLKAEEGQVDMRKDLTVVGVLLEMAAANALNAHGGKDVGGKVGDLSQKLLTLAGDQVLTPEEGELPTHTVERWIPIAHGTRLALKVNGLTTSMDKNAEAGLKSSLKGLRNKLDGAIRQKIDQIKTEANGKKRRAVTMYEELQKL